MHTKEFDWSKILITAEVRPVFKDPAFPEYAKDATLCWRSVKERFQSQSNRCGSLLPLNLDILDRKELKSNKSIKKTSIVAERTPSIGGYTYSWKSSRWFANARHHVQFVIFEKLNSEDLIVRHIFHTSQFALQSTRYIRYKRNGGKKKRTLTTNAKIIKTKNKTKNEGHSELSQKQRQEHIHKEKKELLQKLLRKNSTNILDDEYISISPEKGTPSSIGSHYSEMINENIDNLDSIMNDNTENDGYGNINKQITMELLNLKRRIEIDGKTPEVIHKKNRRNPVVSNNPTSFLVPGHDYNSNTTNSSFTKLYDALPNLTVTSHSSSHVTGSIISNIEDDLITPTMLETTQSTTIVTPTIII